MGSCKKCGSKNVSVLTANEAVCHNGASKPFVFDYSACNGCGREFLTKQQILDSEACLRDARKAFGGQGLVIVS